MPPPSSQPLSTPSSHVHPTAHTLSAPQAPPSSQWRMQPPQQAMQLPQQGMPPQTPQAVASSSGLSTSQTLGAPTAYTPSPPHASAPAVSTVPRVLEHYHQSRMQHDLERSAPNLDHSSSNSAPPERQGPGGGANAVAAHTHQDSNNHASSDYSSQVSTSQRERERGRQKEREREREREGGRMVVSLELITPGEQATLLHVVPVCACVYTSPCARVCDIRRLCCAGCPTQCRQAVHRPPTAVLGTRAFAPWVAVRAVAGGRAPAAGAGAGASIRL